MTEKTTTPPPTKNNDSTATYHHFRLFSYLSISVLSLSIIVGLFLILQHLGEEQNSVRNIANQKTLIENQNILKNLTNDLKTHELLEMKELQDRTDISSNNSKKLDRVLEILKSKP